MSRAGQSHSDRGEDGFTVLEVVAVIAILAAVAAMIVPALPRGTSRARLESYAIATAALLKADRNSAIRRRAPIATRVDAASRMVRAGSSSRVIRIPDDVAVDALLASRCARYADGQAIRFFPSGMSCGGVISLSRPGFGYQVRTNWLTGGVEVVAINRT